MFRERERNTMPRERATSCYEIDAVVMDVRFNGGAEKP